MMAVRILLKSCATPPASEPMASIFCEWRSCSSSFLRSVMSLAMQMALQEPWRNTPEMLSSTGNSRLSFL